MNKRALTASLTPTPPTEGIPVDSDSPFYLPARDMDFILDCVPRGWFVGMHASYSEALAHLLAKHGAKVILIVRDPRDVVVSHAHYLASRPTHYMYHYYQSLSLDERIITSIQGVAASSDHPQLTSTRERLTSTLPWMAEPYTYTTYFEKLVGAEGGGSHLAQIDELRAIAAHLDLSVSERTLEEVSRNLFGGTKTFRKGTIGQWKTALAPKHRDLCKEFLGDLLVELGYEDSLDW